jgi:hypothetical protein
LSTRSIVPRKNEEGGIGTADKKWKEGYFKTLSADNITFTPTLDSDLDFQGLYQCHDLQAPTANGEAIRATAKITEVLLESATDLKHAAVTVSAPIAKDAGQALSLVNDAAATVTEIDTGALANSDTVIPTSKAVTTAIAASGGGVTQAEVIMWAIVFGG